MSLGLAVPSVGMTMDALQCNEKQSNLGGCMLFLIAAPHSGHFFKSLSNCSLNTTYFTSFCGLIGFESSSDSELFESSDSSCFDGT